MAAILSPWSFKLELSSKEITGPCEIPSKCSDAAICDIDIWCITSVVTIPRSSALSPYGIPLVWSKFAQYNFSSILPVENSRCPRKNLGFTDCPASGPMLMRQRNRASLQLWSVTTTRCGRSRQFKLTENRWRRSKEPLSVANSHEKHHWWCMNTNCARIMRWWHHRQSK